ncbi:MAG TPA: bifunctional alpha/beta hydrolase/OsmC family protein [Burkholderiaceae bacterium]|nr:bifunctional alpha/beta hydrolase/OsmC family protein [Burkholderiaceae bacterium]
MPSTEVTFHNPQQQALRGVLETPEGEAQGYAIFAHCFTCSKNSVAATYISRALAQRGMAVLRFDFTGLGGSEGDFSDTNFSSNIEDLVAAANFLAENYAAPALLIGHSLGGAAVLAAAQHLPEVKAVVTIGAPATADHIAHVFAGALNEIRKQTVAQVNLGGRTFSIRKQLIDDLAQHNTVEHIGALRKALLIFHSPLDEVVSIDEAARIFVAAKHPKSFVSLDRADHLLSNKTDAAYIAAVLTAWAGQYLEASEADDRQPEAARSSLPAGTVQVVEKDQKFAQQISTAHHRFVSDEPRDVGGADSGPNPYELLLAALGSCTAMTLRMYAQRKRLPLETIEVTLSHERVHAQDCADCSQQDARVDLITRRIKLSGDLDARQRERLLEIANRCPVHRTLENQIVINTEAAQ